MLEIAPPPTAPAAPPAAPSPAPAPAAAPAPTASPTPSPAPVESHADAFADFDAKFLAAGSDLAPKPAPKADAGEKAPPAAGKAPSPEPVKPAAPAAPEPTRTPKELRTELERVRTEAKTASEAKIALEAKIADFEKKGKDTEALLARLDAREKEFEKLQGELRALKQEASPEFKAKYDVPFERAARFAKRTVEGMMKTDGTKADFDKDFVPLYRLPFNQALEKAQELFGEAAAPAIMQRVSELQQLDFQRQEAFEEEKKGWAEKTKQEEAAAVENRLKKEKAEAEKRSQFKTLHDKVSTELQQSVEGYRDPVEDKEAEGLRKQGYEIFDAPVKDQGQYILKAAHIRHRVAAYGPNQLQIQRLKTELAAVKTELAGYKPTRPGEARKPGGPDATAPEESWESGALKAVKAA